MPPAPINASTSYSPKRVPGTSDIASCTSRGRPRTTVVLVERDSTGRDVTTLPVGLYHGPPRCSERRESRETSFDRSSLRGAFLFAGGRTTADRLLQARDQD